MDKPIRDNGGQTFIPGYSFRTTDNPDFALFNVRLRGRIKDGVITTDPVPQFDFNPGQGTVTTLYKAQVRLEPQPDGSVKGYLGGYQDWRRLAYSGYSEGLFGFQAPGVYYSLKRNADGLRDPVTGEYNGISTILEIDTVPAFITPATPSGTATARAGSTGRTSR